MCRPVRTNSNFSPPGRAEDGHALLAKTAFVVLQLPIEPRDPVGLNQADEDLADQPLLVGRVEVAVDHRLGHVPVGRDPSPQQAERFGLVVPAKTDLLPLFGGERVVEDSSPATRRRPWSRGQQPHGICQWRSADAGKHRCRTGRFEEAATREIRMGKSAMKAWVLT